VSVGQPALLGLYRGKPITSGIRKTRVDTPEVAVSTTNIAGDRQADLRVHGGPDKAIFCYPSESVAYWREALGYESDGVHSAVGENLTLAGIIEEEACIGDVWRWGSVTLQISQPRWPCFKLEMHTGRHGLVTEFLATGRCGWYVRVLEPGTAPTAGEITVITRDPQGITVREAFVARRDRASDPEVFERVRAHPRLAAAWSR
jgi:MOSC domain-containing protein YiiM